MPTTVTQEAIQLDFRDGERPVTVTPKDQDRFITTVQHAAWACQMGHKTLQYEQKLLELFGYIHTWCSQRPDFVEKVLAAFLDGHWVFFFTSKSNKYDFAFGDAMANLDLEVATKFDDIAFDTLQIPAHSPGRICTFIEPSRAMLIYGDNEGAPREVGA